MRSDGMTSPRDALLSQSATADVRGRAFNFHRLLDHACAVTSPIVAAVAALEITYRMNYGLLMAGSIAMGVLMAWRP